MSRECDIAIVGMAGRFPGARELGAFWRNLAGGVESITRVEDREILQSGVPERLLRDPRYVKAAPVLEQPGHFDAAFFGYSPAEARTLDPQHRLLLELAVEALEHAGCDAERYRGRIGVFAGSALNTYFAHVGLDRRLAEEYIPTLIGNDKDFLATRVSYKLNLKGPSITVQTACSTSMVAVHLACQSLLGEESNIALAGAVSVRVPHRAGYLCDGGGVVSPDGRVRAFDAGANGTVFGSGGGVLVLKRLADALADGDAVHAVIKGSAVNNDGSAKAGYTAPSVDAQADAVLEALANAGVGAEDISCVEAHGSGTPLGDPIEVRALTKAFRASTRRSGYCALGSVKTNIGHLDAAAAVAGIIKTVLALRHRQLPPSLHYARPNPEIDFPSTPFYVNARLREWRSDGPRRAAVISTGMGGTNAVAVLEEAPPSDTPARSPGPQLLVLSAKTQTALAEAAQRLHAHLERYDDIDMTDVAHTLQVGRKAYAHRQCLVCTDRADAIAALGSKRGLAARSGEQRRPRVLLLPGIGDHYVGMAHELYAAWPIFRQELERCARILEPQLGVDIREVLYPKSGNWRREGGANGIDLKKMLGGNQPQDAAARTLNQTRYAQPALFTIEYAIARAWQALGVAPDAIVGHSMGEYVAACLAQVLSLEDALRLIAVRARMVSELPQGGMLAVTLAEAELLPLLPENLSLSLINGPRLCVVAGPEESVARLQAELAGRGILCRRVQNAHAFHSKMLEPIAGAFAEEVRKVRLHEPKIPYISNVTGTWIARGEATRPSYWAEHATRSARFDDALRELWRLEDPILLEAGPGRTLSVLAMQHPERREGAGSAVSSIRHHYENASDMEFLWQGIGRLWLQGVEIQWENAPASGPRRKIALPTYAFEREEHWLEPVSVADAGAPVRGPVRKNPDPAQWLYAPSWKRVLPRSGGVPEGAWLVLADDTPFCAGLIRELEGADVLTVRAGEGFRRVDARSFTIDPASAGDCESLVRTLRAEGSLPHRIAHAWSVAPAAGFAAAQALGFYSLLHLSRALPAHDVREDIELFVLSSGVQDVHGAETLHPEKATLLGPCMVIRQEYPNVRVRAIDVDAAHPELAARELLDPDASLFVAHRNGQRWVQAYEPVALRGAEAPLREAGVYLITGGRGRIGTAIARHLAQKYKARLVLVGRSAAPGSTGDVLHVQADVADANAMRKAVQQALQRFGALHGVIHAAGIVGDAGYKEIKDSDARSCEAHFRAKAHGVHALEQALDGRPLDFCLLMSSLTSVLGGIGQAAYASSNLYLDAFARRHNRASTVRWLSVNWDLWRLDEAGALPQGLGAALKDLGMSAAEALSMLETVLAARNADQLVVSTGDLGARIDQWVKLESLQAAPPAASARRPALRTAFDAPRDDTERAVARIWQDALGIDAVGTHDSFAELGGHSLIAVRIVAELGKAFHIDLPLRSLFDAPTVAELARHVDALVWAAGSKQRASEPGERVEIEL
jgi:acyl transferase domain-containing protein/acyl carrier protein